MCWRLQRQLIHSSPSKYWHSYFLEEEIGSEKLSSFAQEHQLLRGTAMKWSVLSHVPLVKLGKLSCCSHRLVGEFVNAVQATNATTPGFHLLGISVFHMLFSIYHTSLRTTLKLVGIFSVCPFCRWGNGLRSDLLKITKWQKFESWMVLCKKIRSKAGTSTL